MFAIPFSYIILTSFYTVSMFLLPRQVTSTILKVHARAILLLSVKKMKFNSLWNKEETMINWSRCVEEIEENQFVSSLEAQEDVKETGMSSFSRDNLKGNLLKKRILSAIGDANQWRLGTRVSLGSMPSRSWTFCVGRSWKNVTDVEIHIRFCRGDAMVKITLWFPGLISKNRTNDLTNEANNFNSQNSGEQTIRAQGTKQLEWCWLNGRSLWWVRRRKYLYSKVSIVNLVIFHSHRDNLRSYRVNPWKRQPLIGRRSNYS